MEKLSGQARLQIDSEGLDQPKFRVVDAHQLAALPEPSDGDIFFDFEGDPMWTPDGSTWELDYLFGLVDTQGNFRAFWAHDLVEERQALLDFLDYVEDKRRQHPDMHIYHYASYERTHLSSIAQRHGVAEDRVDDLLRGHILVDLYRVLGGALQLGTSSYSIKKVEALHMVGEKREGVTTAADSVDQYAQYVQLRDAGMTTEAERILQEIANYNEYDCVSTLKLRDWLRNLAADHGALAVTANVGSSNMGPTLAPEDETDKERKDRLAFETRANLEAAVLNHAGDAFDPGRTDDQRAWGLAGAALRYHEREGKSFWWEHFTRLSEPADEWAEHRNVFHIESAEVTRDWSREKPRSRTLSRDLTLHGAWSEGSTPATGDSHLIYGFPGPRLMYGPESGMRDCLAATIIRVAPNTVHVTEKTTMKYPQTHGAIPGTLTPGPPPDTRNLQATIERWVSTAVVGGALPDDSLGDLLRRRPSRLRGGGLSRVDGEDYVSAVTDSALRLSDSYLAVQGPPGTGKTYVAANTIIRLVRDHKWTVGVVAQSHKVVDNVLEGVISHGLDPKLVGKAQPPDRPMPGGVTEMFPNSKGHEFLAAHPDGCVVGGTAWLFTQLGNKGHTIDLLIVDEAGQYSLANTIAAGACARNLILFGDPQQLPQVSQGSHPEPVETSALGFLSDGRDVLPAEYGYFLAQSRRMDAAVTQPVSELSYEGQLTSHACTRERDLQGVEPGLETVFVEHSGNVTESSQEAEKVVQIVSAHLGQLWADDNQQREVGQDDVMVLTPYNAQVQAIRTALDAAGLTEVRAGTVDKFQGQEAVISIISLAASSATEVPRGLSFLLMRNRLNVAISRAKWKAYLVCSPALLEHLPNTPQGLAEMSAFARLAQSDSAALQLSH